MFLSAYIKCLLYLLREYIGEWQACSLQGAHGHTDRQTLSGGQTDTERALLEEGAAKLLMCLFCTVIEHLLCTRCYIRY